MDWYRSKRAIVARLEGIVGRLAAAGVPPDAVTLAAVPVAALGGLALLASPSVPAALLLVPVLAGLRLVLNLLDGALARETGRSHPRGELFNEVGDRVADGCFLVPVAFLPGAWPPVVLLGVAASFLASYIGVVTRAAGGSRLYDGILSKPGRMVLLALFSVAAFVVGRVAWGVFGPILLIGATLTAIQRTISAVRELR